MKILHVETRHRLGGAERNLVHTIDWQLRQGHAVEVAVGGQSTVDDFPVGAVVHRVEPLTRALRPSADARASAALRRLIDARGYDVVHTHQSKAGVVARVAARGHVLAIAHTIHMPSFGPGYGRAASQAFLYAERFCGRFTDLYAAVGRELVDLYAGASVAPRDRFHVVRSPIDLDAYAAERAATSRDAELAWPAQGARAVTVGSLEPRKRFDLVLRQLAEPIRHGTLSLVVAGQGPERSTLEALARELAVTDRVRFAGHVERPASLLAAADVLVHASRVEGVPQVVLQALAAGTPVVATEAEGLREVTRAPIEIVPRDGTGIAAAVEITVTSPPPPVALDALDHWRIERVNEQLAAFEDRVASLVEARRATVRGR